MRRPIRFLFLGLALTAALAGAVELQGPALKRLLARPVESARSVRLGEGAAVWLVLPRSPTRTDITVEAARTLGLSGTRLAPGQVLWGGWRVEALSPEAVRLKPIRQGAPIYLGLRDGYVAIFLGPPALGIVEEVTGIRENSLLPGDRQRLARGVGAPSLAAAWSLLQGFQEGGP